MSIVSAGFLFARGGLVLAVALVLVRSMRGSSASLRASVIAASLLGVVALPALHALAPAAVSQRLTTAARALVRPPSAPVAEPVAGRSSLTAAPPAPAPSRSVPWGPIAFAVWILGAIAIAARAGVGAARARGIARRGSAVRGMVPTLLTVWRSLGGRTDPPRLVASAEIEAPIVIGAVASVVVVPTCARDWSAERWRVVLLHELAHVRRRDGVTNLIAQLACALHWVNPLVWIAAGQLRALREHAADDAVLRAGLRASTYAEHLLEIAVGTTIPYAAIAMAEPSRFEARMTALLETTRSRRPAGARAAVSITAGLGAVAAIAACMSPEAAPPPKSPHASMAGSCPVLQATAQAEIDRALAEYEATGAVAVVLDAKTGALVAQASRNLDPAAPRNNGSTMKPFTIAAALEAGAITTDTTVDCEQGERHYGDKKLTDSAPHGVLGLGDILAVSSNVCVAKLAEPMGDRLGEELRRYHFPAPEHIDTRSFDGAALAAGESLEISSLALASAYTAFANDGVLRTLDGKIERVMSAETARAVHGMLDQAVNSPEGTGHGAQLPDVRVIGKTGTASTTAKDRYYASFVGIVPADAPRFVILVGVDGTEGYGGKVAAPLFARIAAHALSGK